MRAASAASGPAVARWGGAALLVLLLLVGGLPAVAQSHPVDAVVSDLRLAAADPYWTDGTPHETRVEVTVSNAGTSPITYTLTYYWKSTFSDGSTFQTLLMTDNAGSTDGGTLAPGASNPHGIKWLPQFGQAGQGAVVAVVDVAGERTPADNTAEIPVFVASHSLALAWGDEDPAIRADEGRFFRLHVRNRGLQPERLVPSLGASGSGLQASMDPLDVGAGEEAVALLHVRRPFQPPMAAPVNYTVTLRNASLPGWLSVAPLLEVVPEAQPLPDGALATTVESPSSTVQLPRSGRFDLRFPLANDGTVDDGVSIAADGPHGWGLEATPARLDLAPGEGATIHLTGSAPADAVPGALVTLRVVVASERAAAGDAAGQATVRVAGGSLDVAAPALPEQVYQGDAVNVTVELHNIGNVALPSGLVTLTASPAVGGTPGTVVAPPIPAGARRTVTLPIVGANDAPVVRAGDLAFLDVDGDRRPGAGEPLYVAQHPDAAGSGFKHPVGNGTVSAGDVRLNVTSKLPGSRVIGADKDLGGKPLQHLPGPSCADADRDGRCTATDALYLDLAEPIGSVDPGDFRLTASNGLSPVASLPLAVLPVGQGTGAFTAGSAGNGGRLPVPVQVGFRDLDRNGFSANDTLYLNAVGAALADTVGAGDVRLTASPAGAAGSLVRDGDADDGAVITSLPPAAYGSVCFTDRNRDGAQQPNEPAYLHRAPSCGSAKVAEGDLRLTSAPDAVAGRLVGARDPDRNRTLSPPATASLAFFDGDASGAFGPADTAYVHFGDCPSATACGGLGPTDVVLSGPGAFRRVAPDLLPAGSRVAAGERDTGLALAPAHLEGTLAFADANGQGAFDAGDAVYLDADRDGRAGPGDLRLTALSAPRGGGVAVVAPFGSRVAPGDADNGSALAPLLTRETDGVLGDVTLGARWSLDADANGIDEQSVLSPVATTFVRHPELRLSSPKAFEATPGEALDLSLPPRAFELTNRGNAAERILVSAGSGAGTATAAFREATLQPGETRIVPVHVEMPASAPYGIVEVRLEATLAGHNATRVQSSVLVTLRDLLAPLASLRDLPAVADPRADLVVAVLAEDDVGVENVTVAFTGGEQPLTLPAHLGDDGLWTVSTRLPTGNYTVVATAKDGAGREGASPPGQVQVLYLPPPRLVSMSLEDGQGVRPDEPFVVVLEDALGVVDASVRVDSGPRLPLPVESAGPGNPVRLRGNLGNLTSGEHRLEFEAHNAVGETWTAVLHVQASAAGAQQAAKSHESPTVPPLLAALLGLAAAALRRRR